MKRVFALFFLSFILLSGCGKKSQPAPSCSVIQSITVMESNFGSVSVASYEEESQIAYIMGRFRHKNTHEQFCPPMITPGRVSTVVVTCANGEKHIYDSLDDVYFRKDHGLWKRVMGD